MDWQRTFGGTIGTAAPGQTAGVRLADEPAIRIGPLLIEPSRRRLGHVDGRNAAVEPRAMQVLVALLREPGAVVSHDHLFELCWNGRIVSDDAISRALSRLRSALAKVADDVVRIETVSRVGHRIVTAAPFAPTGPSSEPARWMPRLLKLSAGIVTGLLALALVLATVEPPVSSRRVPTRLALLPFRDLAGSNEYVLEGLREALHDDLGRTHSLEVVGAASTDMLAPSASAAEAGRRLGVTHVLSGDVAMRGGAIRVTLVLRDAVAGSVLWAESVPGRIEDLRGLQEAIGGRVTSALHAEARPGLAPARSRTSGEVYQLYLAARGLIRRRDLPGLATAVQLLRRAVRLDPGFAPAWSSLAAATALGANRDSPEAAQILDRQALAYVRRALALQPDLAEAHGTLSMILGFDTPEAYRHIVRAAELDPHDGELLYWRGHAHGSRNEFSAQLAAYRRAMRLDPLWHRPFLSFAEAAAALGYHSEVQAELARYERSAAPADAAMVTVWHRAAIGDLSGAALQVARVRDLAGGTKGDRPDREIALFLLRLGLTAEARRQFPLPPDLLAVWRREVPTAAALRTHNDRHQIGEIPALVARHGLKLMVNAGRAAAIADAYDGPAGLLGIGPRAGPSPARLVMDGAIVVLALRQAGRQEEAGRLLAAAGQAVDAALRQEAVSTPVLAAAAQIRAVQGRHDEAIALLERAVARGWLNSARPWLPRIDDEPVFRSLRGDPRFVRVGSRLNREMERERREMVAILPRLQRR